MSMKHSKYMSVIVIAAVGVIVAMMVSKFAFSRIGSAAKPQLPVPEASFSPFEVRVRAVKRNVMPLEQGTVAATSKGVAIVCGVDDATAGRYETRNGALRSIARRRDSLPSGLVRLGRSTGDSLR